jgi:hypothetical protein
VFGQVLCQGGLAKGGDVVDGSGDWFADVAQLAVGL